MFFCLLLTQLSFQREKAEKLTEFGHRLCVPKLEPVFGSLISVPGGALARRQQLHCPLDVLQLLHWDGILQQQRHTGTEHEEAAAAPKPGGGTCTPASETTAFAGKTHDPPLSVDPAQVS